MEKRRRARKQMQIIFVDLEKACDKVPRKLVWEALRRRGVDERYVKVVKDMYKDWCENGKRRIG